MPDVNGLRVTPYRKAFLRAVAVRGRVVRYHSTGEAWDNTASLQVSARLREAFSAGWVEPVPEEDLWERAYPKTILTYFRLTPLGRTALGSVKDNEETKSHD
jgi:hypothetical protein